MATNTLSRPAIQDSTKSTQAERIDQYSLWQIIGIWAVATLPMALLTWVVAPALIPISPLHPGLTFWLVIIAGMAWQFVVTLVILHHELGTLRWSVVPKRIWLQTPRDPKTDQPNRKLWWWVTIPVVIDTALVYFLGRYLDAPMAWLFPALKAPAYMDIMQLVSPQFVGQWWIMGIVLTSLLFNYFLGEELLWRGVLLPKMQGVFGKYDWVANAIVFGLYHVHKPWSLPSVMVTNLTYSWPAARFRSNWMSIVVHGLEGLPVLIMPLAVIMGLITK
jgi:CAAX protease family protein